MNVQRGIQVSVRPVASKLMQVLAVVVLGWFIGQFVLTAPSYFIWAALGAVILGYLLIGNLQLAFIAYILIAAQAFGESPGLQSPHSGYKAGLMPSQIILGFIAALWMIRMIFRDGVSIVKSEMNLPMAVLVGVSLLSLVMNNVLQATREQLFHQLVITQVAEVGLLMFSVCAFFVAANVLKDRKWIMRAVVPVVLLGTYFAAHRIFGFRLPVAMIWGSLLLAISVALVSSFLLFSKLTRWPKIGLWVLLGALLFAAYSNLAWVSGWFATSVAITVVGWYRSKALFILIIAIGLFVGFAYPGVYWDIHNESEEGSDFDRFTIWEDSFRMFMDVNPLLGIGPGNYHPYVFQYHTIWFGGTTYTTAHSNYVQMAAEMGLLGLGAFLWVIVSGLRLGHRAARSLSRDVQWLGVAGTATLAGIAAASLFGDYLFPSRGNNGIVNFGTTVYTWLILGIIAAAAANLRHGSDVEQDVSGADEHAIVRKRTDH